MKKKKKVKKTKKEVKKKKKEIKNKIPIPERIKNLNFVLLGGDDGKKPFEKAWQKKIHRFDDEQLIKHLEEGKNYGVQSNNSIIDGNFLIVIDFDKKEFQNKVIKQFPKTFTSTSGSPKQCNHLWFASDNNQPFKIKDKEGNILADVIGAGNQVVAPNSKHKSGSTYSIVKDIPFTFISYSQVEAILKPHDETPKKPVKPKKQYSPKGISNDITEKIINSISMEEILKDLGIDTSKNPTDCFGHTSIGGKCLSWTTETAHCFHCQGLHTGWNKFSLIREAKNLTDKETFEWFADKAGMSKELKQTREEYKEEKKKDYNVITRRGQIETFWEEQPFYYDENKIFWLWDKEKFKWVMSDEVDFCNSIFEAIGIDTISSRDKSEIVEAFKQVGRLHKPKEIKKSWVQFKNIIYDIETDEEFEATPKYFVSNPIPWKVGKNEDTPELNKLFIAWVGEEKNEELYEFMAFCIMPIYFIHRIICLIGSGANGKGTFLKVLKKFVGKDNTTSSSMEMLIKSRFEGAKLFKKLICLIGETHFNTLSRTEFIKGASGEDTIRGEHKGKTPFDFENYAKFIMATNCLPMTTDKTDGFYRRWKIIDFLNKFKKEKNVLKNIPDEEYENLSLKCLRIVKRLWKDRIFINDGDFEARRKRYEEKSNPLMLFINRRYKKDVNGSVEFSEFAEFFKDFLDNEGYRALSSRAISMQLKEEGFDVKKTTKNNITTHRILGLTQENTPNTPNTPTLTRKPYKENKSTLGDYGHLGYSTQKKEVDFTKTGIKEELEDEKN